MKIRNSGRKHIAESVLMVYGLLFLGQSAHAGELIFRPFISTPVGVRDTNPCEPFMRLISAANNAEAIYHWRMQENIEFPIAIDLAPGTYVFETGIAIGGVDVCQYQKQTLFIADEEKIEISETFLLHSASVRIGLGGIIEMLPVLDDLSRPYYIRIECKSTKLESENLAISAKGMDKEGWVRFSIPGWPERHVDFRMIFSPTKNFPSARNYEIVFSGLLELETATRFKDIVIPTDADVVSFPSFPFEGQ